MNALRWTATALLALAFVGASGQTQPGKILPIEGKVLDIKGATLGLDARLKDLGARVVGEEIVIALAADVLFDFDKHDLKPAAVESLTKVAAVLKDLDDSPATVEGHTDAKGDDAYNLALSKRRAEAVENWLVKSGGVDAARISAKGLGETRPVASNTKPDGADDPEGRKKNRRVEIRTKKG
jgi:outer membrane protein OmpA-like peptidoglycan-associated protein